MEDMIKISKRSVGVKEGQRIVRIRILNLIEDMAHFEKDKAAIEAELDSTMKSLEIGYVLQSVPGVATIISSAFLGEVGDISRFTSWKQVRSLSGLNLVEDSSGQRKGSTKISKRGRPYLRYMLYMAGENGIRNNPEMNKYYRYLRNRKKNPLEGNQAIVAVGLKMMRMLFYIAKTGERYNANKALGEVRLQQIASLA